MPGPMGGGRGGGFSGGSRGGSSQGGGSSGGGRRSGGFHGEPMHHRPHRHHYHYYDGPVFLLSLLSRRHREHYAARWRQLWWLFISIPIVFLLIFVALFGSLLGEPGSENNGYSEAAFQTYAQERYEEYFSSTDDYEGNILLVFLVYDGYTGYDCLPYGGYNIDAETEELFGSYFESEVQSAIPNYYEFALTKSLRQIVSTMTSAVPESDGASVIDTSSSVLYNQTHLEIDSDIVNSELQKFTEKTGYPIAIVVEYGTLVFDVDDGSNVGLILFLIIIAVIVIAVIIVFINIKKKKSASIGGTDKTDPNAGQGKYDPNTGEWK